MSIDDLKQTAIQTIDGIRADLIALSHDIHARPELAFKEERAAAALTAFLQQHGFRVDMPVAGLETAFQASYGEGPPRIGILAEYDALPELGHACGHNIIAASAVGAGRAAKEAVDRYGGEVKVLGTPGEEGGGGKIDMIPYGLFDDLDAVLMVHPSSRNVGIPRILAAIVLKAEYFGRESHAASAPEEGVNALDALLVAFNAVNALRQHVPDSVRIHGVITDGGKVPNVVPDHSAATFIVRAAENDYLAVLQEKVLGCFRAGAEATGARLEYKWQEKYYAAMKSNRVLAGLFCNNMALLGRRYELENPSERFGSTDMGNVSVVAPAIHPTVAVDEGGLDVHTREFCEAVIGSGGDQALLDAAKAMAMTVVDLLGDTERLTTVKTEFQENSPPGQ